MLKLKTYEMNRLTPQDYRKRSGGVIVLDNLRSMHNVGAAFRIGDAFGVSFIQLCGITATPPRKEISKTALGAEAHVPWKYIDDTCAAVLHLQSEGYIVVAIEQSDASTPLDQFTPDPAALYALVFGHEVLGISSNVLKTCDICIDISQYGAKHSLNVSVSIGIAAWGFWG